MLNLSFEPKEEVNGIPSTYFSSNCNSSSIPIYLSVSIYMYYFFYLKHILLCMRFFTTLILSFSLSLFFEYMYMDRAYKSSSKVSRYILYQVVYRNLSYQLILVRLSKDMFIFPRKTKAQCNDYMVTMLRPRGSLKCYIP